MSNNGGVVEDMISRLNEGDKVSGAMNMKWKFGFLGVNLKRKMYEKIVVRAET